MSQEPVPTAAVHPPRPGRLRLKLLIGLPLMAVALWYLAEPLQRDIQNLRQQGQGWPDLTWPWLAAALGFLLAARTTNALNFRHLFAALGKTLRARQVVPLVWVASLGRYIPGKVMSASAIVLFCRLGITLPVVLAGVGLSMALMMISSLVVALPLLYLPPVAGHVPGRGWLVGVVLPAALLVLWPGNFTRLLNLVLRRLGRAPLPERLHTGPYLCAIGMTFGRLLFLGLALYCTARGLGPLPVHLLALALGAAALASFAGFVAFPLPAGVGVHEAVYVLAFTGVSPAPALLAIAFRILNILTDAIAGTVGFVLLRDEPAVAAAPAVSAASPLP
jgi:hypothetical protein